MTVSNNDFVAEATPVANNIGMLVTGGPGFIGGTFANNTFTGEDYGVVVWGTPSGVTLNSTNSVVDSKTAGVYVTNNVGFNPMTLTPLNLVGTATAVDLDGISITTTSANAIGLGSRRYGWRGDLGQSPRRRDGHRGHKLRRWCQSQWQVQGLALRSLAITSTRTRPECSLPAAVRVR